MKLSAKTDYGCLAMLELAAAYNSNQPITASSISETQKIPNQFLIQILQQLRGAGLVVSVRGAGGGYRLARAPNSITLLEVVDAIDGNDSAEVEQRIESPTAAVLKSFCQEIQTKICEMLRERTLADLMEEAASITGPMWYI